jgi:hypothetical protein
MSRTSVAGNGSGIGDELKVTLQDLARRLAAIEEIIRPLVPLEDHVPILQEMVAGLQQQQATTTATLTCIDNTVCTIGGANGRRHNAGEDDGDPEFPTVHKVKFLKYDGTSDPLPWLNRCDRYFAVQRTPENKKVMYASLHLLDVTQLWFHRLELNNGPPNWTRFILLIQIRFSLLLSPIGELALLRHEGSVDDYCKQFMSLSCRDLAISESHQIQLFTAGLGKPLRTDVSLQKLETLDEAIMYARAYEQ